MVVVNAGMGGTVAAHLRANGAPDDPMVTDHTDHVGKIDLQGLAAAKVLGKIVRDPEAVFRSMAYFSFKGRIDSLGKGEEQVELRCGSPVILSRTGYTGEFGFELYMDPAMVTTVWEEILQAGREFGVIPCGLAARDSLRAGACLPLSHQDIGPWPFVNNPWIFALPWTPGGRGFTKDFIGAQALLSSQGGDHTLPFAGYDARKITPGPESAVFDLQGERIGSILTCTTDMAIGRVGTAIVAIGTAEGAGRPAGFIARGLCCGFVKVKGALAPGQEVILADGKRRITVEIRRDIRPGRTALCAMDKML